MIRRIGAVTLIAVSALLLVAGSAGAVTSRTRACLFAARKTRVNCITMCRSDYISTFSACYGPGSACAAACLNDQANCQSGPNTTLSDCKIDTLFCPDGNENGAPGDGQAAPPTADFEHRQVDEHTVTTPAGPAS